MDEELKQILDNARASGASANQLQGIVNSYNQKKKIGGGGGVDVLEPPTKKLSNSLQENNGGEIEGLSKPFPTQKTVTPSIFPSYKDAPDTVPHETLNVADFNKQFEDVTGYKDFSLGQPVKATGLRELISDDLFNKRKEAFEQKKFKTYSKEKDKIDKISEKIYFGDIQPEELSQLQQSPFSKNIANNIIKEYVPEITDVQDGNPATIELATKRIKEKNRINFVNAESENIRQLDNTAQTLLSDFQLEADNGTDDIKELKSTLSVTDFNNNDEISSAIQKIKKIDQLENSYYGMGSLKQTPELLESKRKSTEKNNAALQVLTDRLNYNVSRKGVSPSLNWIDDRIGQSFISKLNETDRGQELTDKLSNDKIKLNQFKLGLTALEKQDPVMFKNVTGAIANEKKIADTDFNVIANIGQQIDNVARFRAGAYNPEFIDSETRFDYTTFGQKKSLAAAQIGEWFKSKGLKNINEFSPQLINRAASELGINNKEIVNSLIFDEKLGFYDAIPKSGWVDDIMAGVMQPLVGINSTISTWNESPAQTYLRSKSLDGTFGAAKVPNEKGEYSDILPSERGKFTTDMFRGLGQFIPQVLLTKGVGAGLKGATALAGIATTANQAKNIADYGGTFISTFLQSYGQSYEEHLQKTGDEDTASLMGTIDGISSGAFELILPDVKIADKALSGLKQGLTSDLVGLVKKGGNPAELATKARPYVQKFFQSATNTLVQEDLEELGTQYVDFVTESIFDPASAKDRNVNKELWDTFKSTTAAMLLPSILGAGGGSFTKDFTTKSLHSAAINFDSYKESLQKSLDKEYISQDDFNKSVQVLSTHRESIANAPEINSTGKELTPEKRLDYALEDTKIKYYKEQEKKSAGDVAKEMWNEKIKESEEIQRKILLPKELTKTEPAVITPKENKPTEVIEIAPKENVPTEKTKGAAIILPETAPKPNIIEVGKKTEDTKLSEPIEGLDEQGIPIGENVPAATTESKVSEPTSQLTVNEVSKEQTVNSGEVKVGDEVDTPNGKGVIDQINSKGAATVKLEDGSKVMYTPDLWKGQKESTQETATQNTEVKTIEDAVKKMDEVENYTFQDMVNDVEHLANESGDKKILDAVNKYRDAQAEDNKLSGRGDMDAAESQFLKVINEEKKQTTNTGNENQNNSLNLLIKKIKDYATEVISNRKKISRLSEQGERGRKAGGSRNVEATLLLTTGGEKSGKIEGREAQQQAIEDYAKAEGIWFDNIEEEPKEGTIHTGLGKFKDSGVENQVYIPLDNPNIVRKVMKTTNPFNKDNPNEVLEHLDTRISEHNSGLGDTVPYTVTGFGRLSNGDFVVIVEQPHIQDARLATEAEIKQEMAKRGYEPDGKHSYGNENYYITDVNPKNVLVDNQGNYHFIDTLIDPIYNVNEDSNPGMEGVQQQGFGGKSLNEAIAKSLDIVADAIDKGIEIAQAIEQGFSDLRDYYQKNTKSFDEEKLRTDFTKFVNDNFSEDDGTPPTDVNTTDNKKEEPKKIRSVYKNIIERSKLTPEQKEILKNDPNSLYTVLPNETAKQIALDIINEMGVEAAVAEASRKNSTLDPVEKVMVLGAAMDYYAGLAKSAKGDDWNIVDLEIDANEKMQEVAKELGGLGTAYGRAINIFNEIYKLSNLALERKLKKNVDEINKLRNPKANDDAKNVEKIVKDDKNINGIGEEMTDAEIEREADAKKKISELEKEVEDLRKQIKNVTNSKTGTKKNPLKINRVTNDTEYDKRVKEFKQRHRTGISKDDLTDLTYFGLYHLENGLTKFADWVKVMSSKFGGFTEYLKGVYSNIRQETIEKGADKNLFDSDDIVDSQLQKLQDESDAKKIANATKKLAAAKLQKDIENDPDKARIAAPRRAAERIRKDAAVNLDLVTTKNEQTYLKKLITVVQNKAREYYKETKQKVSNVNDWLQFAIANGKADFAIWERTQDEVESQIDADENLTDDEKENVKDFLSNYQESIFDTLLTTGQKEEIIRQKLIDAGYSQERTINGKVVKAVDWNKVIGSSKTIKEAKAAIVKSITDLGFTKEEAANEINSILNDFDNKVADRKTKAINNYLNKGVFNKVKNALGLKGKGKVQKLIEMNNKGILDDSRVKEVLAQDLGIISLTDEDLKKVRELSEKIDKATVPFIRKKYEEQLQYLFDSKSGNLTYLENREFVMNNRLTSLWNQIQNLTGYFRILSTYISTSIKTGSLSQTAKVFRKQWKDGVSDALTVLMGGHVSRGTAFSDLTRSTEGEARVRYLEQGKGKLLGLPDLYLRIAGKAVQINPINALYRKIKYVGRLMESADTIPSNVISGLTQYWQIKKQLELLNPDLSSKEIEQKTYNTMYSMDIETARAQAYKDLKDSGVENPTKYEINRASHEIVERNRNEIISKEFYDSIERLKPTAEQKLKQQGNSNPSEEEIIKEAYAILGRDEPLDIVARGERQALRETGKKTTTGITSIVIMPIDWMQRGLKKQMLNKHNQSEKAAWNVTDAAFNQLLPFVNSIGRWIEMGLELTPYGVLKGIGYKVYGANATTGKDKLNPIEISELGDDYIIRGIQGTAQTLAAMYLMGILKGEGEDDDEEDKITGQYKGKNYQQEKIKQIGNPQRSLDIGGRKFPLDLLGNASYPFMMYSDFLDRRNDENERHGVLYTTAAMYLVTAAQSYSSRVDQYGSILSSIWAGKEEKYLPSLGRIGGNYIGSQFIPFNRFQQEIGELWNPKSTQSITFGENILQQLSVVGGFQKDRPAFDYRGREYDKGDIWVGSPDGIVKMFTKSKTADAIDKELATIDFAATDAFRETKDEENYEYTLENTDGTRRFMTPNEYYKFRRAAANEFNNKVTTNFEIIKNLSILNVEGNVDEQETAKAKRETYSDLLMSAKENALIIIQSETGHTATPIEQKKAEKKEVNKFYNDQKKSQLQGLEQ